MVNTLYAESPRTGIKYMHNKGAPYVDNPKMSARYFLNAIDQGVVQLVEKHRKDLEQMSEEIPVVEALARKPFEDGAELERLKKELVKLEEQISASMAGQDTPVKTVDLVPVEENAEEVSYIVPER